MPPLTLPIELPEASLLLAYTDCDPVAVDSGEAIAEEEPVSDTLVV